MFHEATEPIQSNIHEGFVAKVAAGMSEILNSLRAEISLPEIIPVVVAISGGPDSTALTVALHLIAERLNFSVSACHVNHRLRGEESDGDQQFCENLCARLKTPIRVFLDVLPEKTEHRSESELRERRYQLLSEGLEQAGSRLILTAHTGDDQVETVLFRLVRGSSTTGLAGMSALRAAEKDTYICRPMLSISREECVNFLSELKLAARLDSTNADSKYARNFLRNEVIPLLETRFPRAKLQFERFRQQVSLENEFLTDTANSAIRNLGGHGSTIWSATQLMSHHEAIVKRILAASLEYRGIEVSFERVSTIFELLASKPERAALTLNGRWNLKVEKGLISWADKSQKLSRVHSGEPILLRVPGSTAVAATNRAFCIETWPETINIDDEQLPPLTALEAIVDLSSVRMPLVLRHRRPGDIIMPFGMHVPVSLKKFLHNHKRPPEKTWIDSFETLVVADNAEVLWVPGVGLSERLRIKSRPTHRLCWNQLGHGLTAPAGLA